MLFSPKLSARRLEKIADEHPDIAPVAACHPNGGDISINDAILADGVRQFNRHFHIPSLEGKSSKSSSAGFANQLGL